MRRNIILLFGIIFPIVVAIGYPLFKRYYLYPKNWKEKFHDEAAAQYKDLSDERINQFTECVYKNLSSTYDAFEIPTYKNYTKDDLKSCVTCILENIIDDDSLKTYQKNNIDYIIEKMWDIRHPKDAP